MIKTIVIHTGASRVTLLIYSNFSKSFIIDTDYSKEQLEAVISLDNKAIDIYSRKLNPKYVHYITVERELLSILKALKESRNVYLCQKRKVYTDHKFLTYKTFDTERVMRWQLILEKVDPHLIYMKSSKNIAAFDLSRLHKMDNLNNKVEPTLHSFGGPLFMTIMRFQQKHEALIQISKKKFNNYCIK